ncbi:MAG: long-chain fatty acid--CoA ligase [Candidatus Nanopelagicales bacterium]|nr:long-chain fatty acid--CoA ligase [Candidatus Nanopelagicales bacterium]
MLQDFSAPVPAGSPSAPSLSCHVIDNARTHPDSVVFRVREGFGMRNVTCADFHAEVRAVAKGLIASGIQAGQRIGLMSRTRYEWTLFDCAIGYAGAVSVPIYETSSADQVAWILEDSGAVAVILESDKNKALFGPLAASLAEVRRTWVIDDACVEFLTTVGASVDDAELDARQAAIGPADAATIIYTSGTTGRPKGCVLTQGNFMAEVDGALEVFGDILLAPHASTLLFLPLAHVFGRILGYAFIKGRTLTGFCSDTKTLVPELQQFRPTFVVAVPRVFEKVFNTAQQTAQAGGRGRIFDAAAHTAIAYSQGLETGATGVGLRIRRLAFDALVYRKIRAAMGGRVEYAISGGAPLGARLGHFFRGIGIEVFEGYGLTETTAAIAATHPGAVKIGTVGQPMPGTSIRIAEDGEIMAKGGQVFTRYLNNERATEDSFTRDGWFHTGDLGTLDDDGYLQITGRKKEIIVTAGGKNVAPAVLEDRLRASWLVSNCLVVGEAKPYIAALVTIDPEAFPAWLTQHHKPEGGTVAQYVNDPDLLTDVQAAVDEANAAVSHAEAIKRFIILDHDWTEADGHITPSLKLKRSVVMHACAEAIESLYAG